MWIFPLGAALVSAVFAALIAQQWLTKKRPNQLAWAIALAMFAIASFAAAVGILGGWNGFEFRVYYLFGAIVNVPVLALGTLYLLAPRKLGHAAAVLVAAAAVFAAGATFTAHLNSLTCPASASLTQNAPDCGLHIKGIPRARDVMPENVRTLSRYYSFIGFFVVVGGALWSAWRLARERSENLQRLAAGNILIAAGTFVVAVGSGFARYGGGSVFAVGLLVGVCLMFAGFIRTRPRAQPPSPKTE
jgi:hypothetical protein